MASRENKVVRECWEYLIRAGWFAWRNNSTGVYDQVSGSYRRPPPECINGVSDIIAMKHGQVIFVECKTDKGELSRDQLLFKGMCIKHGVPYFVARSKKDLENAL